MRTRKQQSQPRYSPIDQQISDCLVWHQQATAAGNSTSVPGFQPAEQNTAAVIPGTQRFSQFRHRPHLLHTMGTPRSGRRFLADPSSRSVRSAGSLPRGSGRNMQKLQVPGSCPQPRQAREPVCTFSRPSSFDSSCIHAFILPSDIVIVVCVNWWLLQNRF